VFGPGTGVAGSPPKPAPKCTITGTPGPDVLIGTEGRDVICGLGGDDKILGRGGNDVLLGGAGRDEIYGGKGDDILIGGGQGDELHGGPGSNVLREGLPNKAANYQVHPISSYDVPAGTTVTWKYIGGNCTKDEINGSFVYEPGMRIPEYGAFTVKAEALESCGYERSNARFKVSFKTRKGTAKDVNIDVAQGSAPNIYVRAWHIDCEGGNPIANIKCDGDSVVTSGLQEGPKVPVSFGPLRDPLGPIPTD
jgi:Ca2+-binding RTX toxin-like protein